ncbi:class I SAM-dependent methyltransferase [Candidatus Pacearchaeota archaeon]|nr:class I SAM-dependent methyltransferase [Candidatus Pacearchaeota archaeon]
MEDQKAVWDNIAEEWNEFKSGKPSENVVEFLKTQKGKILDLGSGSGRHLCKFKEDIELKTRTKEQKRKYYLVDFSSEMLKIAEKKAKKNKIPAEFVVADLWKLPFEDNFFDSAICVSALHCVEKKYHKKSVEELYRVLKPKAKAYVGVWNKNSKRFKNAGKEKMVAWRDKGKRYYYLFDEDEVHDLFKKAGFKILESMNSEMMINFIIQKQE